MNLEMLRETSTLSGEVVRMDECVPSRQGPAVILQVEYGPASRGPATPVLNVAWVRVSRELYEGCKADLRVGARLDIVGRLMGVRKNLSTHGFVANEIEAGRILVEGYASPPEAFGR